MIVGVGTDLVEVARIRESIERYGERFVRRIYTNAERTYCFSKANCYERFAARFACKEAGMKAIGTGWSQGVSWQNFEVSNDLSGRPILVLTGAAALKATESKVKAVHLSLTHTATLASAIVILESEN